MLKSWSEELQTEISGLSSSDDILAAKKQLLKTVLAKLEKAVKDAPTSGAKLPGSDFSRDQASKLGKCALSARVHRS